MPQPQGNSRPDAILRLTVQRDVAASSMIPPRFTIDGLRAPITRSGSVDIPIKPGRHHLEVSMRWVRRYGQAALDVDVAPGQVVEVFYAAPRHQFTTGALGLTPQMHRGAAFDWIFVGVVVAVALLGALGLLDGG